MWCPEEHYARKIILRAWWDNENNPSIECPIGDFFGIGHGIVKNFWSLPLQMSPQDGRAFNCWFPMPFSKSARFEVENQSESDTNFYFYIDYERYYQLDDSYARFHAQWRRENPTTGWGDDKRQFSKDEPYLWEVWDSPNLDGELQWAILNEIIHLAPNHVAGRLDLIHNADVPWYAARHRPVGGIAVEACILIHQVTLVRQQSS